MTSPYPPLPPGLAPVVDDLRSSFQHIAHDIQEAVRGYPQITLPSISPAETAPTAIPLAVGWTNFGSGYTGAQYQQIGTRVYLRGLVSNTGAALAANTSYTMGTLPAGVVPTGEEEFAVWTGGNAQRVDVLPTGALVLFTVASVPINSYVSLSGITFSTL
ncbi:MAG: hypothetical protein NVSMB4_20460 [Acidimicrobiales bacterium]